MINKIYNLKNSFVYALRGIFYCIRYERNMRIHIAATVLVTIAAKIFCDFSRTEWCVLILTCALVMSLEAINTAIERLTDEVSPEYSRFAKIAKDVAAGAVLIASIAAVIIGIILFWRV
jgi:diacylglycerol kinase